MRISSDSDLPCCDTFQKKDFPVTFYNAVVLVVKDRLISRFSLFVILSVQCGTCDTKPGFRSL